MALTSLFGGGGSSSSVTRPFKKLQVPSVEEMSVELEELVLQGILTPEDAETILQEVTAYQDMDVDPSTRAAQMEALGELQERVDMGGLDNQALAGIRQANIDTSTQERGNREAILANARARGVGGSGIELANQMLSQQGSAQRAAQEGYQQAALADQRRMEAVGNLANLGGQVRGQDWEQAAAEADAADRINQFNAANRQSTLNENVNRANLAQSTNLAERQRVADANTGVRQEQELHNKGLLAEKFGMDLSKAQGLAGGAAIRTAQDIAERAARRNFLGSMTSSAAGGASSSMSTGAAGGMMSDPDQKKDVSQMSADDALEQLVPRSFKYKNPSAQGAAAGQQVGFMSTDIEKVAPEAVSRNTEGNDMVNYNTAQPAMFALIVDALRDHRREIDGLKGRA